MPFYYSEIIREIDSHFLLSYFKEKFMNKVGGSERLFDIITKHKGRLTEEETEISYYYYRLCKLANKLKQANFNYLGCPGSEWDGYLYATESYADELYLDIVLYKRYDYLEARNLMNLTKFESTNFYLKTLKKKKVKKTDKTFKKWREEMLKSY